MLPAFVRALSFAECEMLKRAYSTFEVKAIGDNGAGKRTFTGIATTPAPDRMGDVVEPTGAQFTLPIPLLWQHNSDQPIGWVRTAKVTKSGIEVECEVADISEPGTLKDRLDEAWQSIKAKLVRGLSIGFNALESARIKDTYSYHYLKWELLELSPVTIPANAEASIATIKSFDRQQRAASGEPAFVVRLVPSPGASGSTPVIPNSPKGNTMRTIAEQISAFKTKRQTGADRMNAIMAAAAEEGRTLDETETEEYDTLVAEIKSLDTHIVRLEQHEAQIVRTAVAVTAGAAAGATAGAEHHGVEVRGGVISVRPNIAKGTAFVRYALMKLQANGDPGRAAELAKRFKDTTPEVAEVLRAEYSMGESVLKAAVAAGNTTDTTWAGPLAYYNNMAGEFIELLRPKTILGRISGFRAVPFLTRIPRQTSGVSGKWVGEGSPKPVQAMGFDAITLAFSKASVIIALTEEIVRMSTPSAEALAQSDMIKGVSQYLDVQFIDPSVAPISGVSPGAITNGLTAVASSGSTLAQIEADISAVMMKLVNANLDLSTAVWVMNPRTALYLSLVRTTQGPYAFPGINVQGGVFHGLNVITSNNVPVSGSPGTTIIVLMDPSEILMADDGAVTVDMSREASLQMSDSPSAGAQQLVSLWQNNMVGLRAERYINWQRRRNAAVGLISGVAY